VSPQIDKPLKSVTHGQCDATHARPTVTFPDAGHHRPLTGTKLYCLATEARVCEQLAQACYLKAQGRESNTRPSESQVQRPNHYATRPHDALRFEYDKSIYESIVVDFPQSLQVCDPPPTSAVNVTLPAAAERRRQLSIDISCKPAAGRCCCRLTGQTDGRTDGRTLSRFADPARHTMPARAVSIRRRLTPTVNLLRPLVRRFVHLP